MTLIGSVSPSSAAEPERIVLNGTVVSRHDPAVTVKLPESVQYLGADRFVLNDPHLGDFDDCELHAFVDSDGSGGIRKLYWVQFEAYLPSHPQLAHTYDSPRHAMIGGLDFYLDTWTSSRATPPTPGSDEAHLHALLAQHGYRLPDLMTVRLVHLTDATKRRELMIIYAESLAPTGYTARQLKTGGADHAKWTAIEAALIRRAKQSIAVKPDGDASR